MKDEIIIRTLMDTEISVLEEFVKKVEDSPKVLEDDKFVSRANFDILKGHLGTLKKLRETSWRNWQMMKDDSDIDTTTAQPMELEYQGRKFESYPGQIENLVKDRDNWREMYDQEFKKNEGLGHKMLLINYDRDMKVENLKKENEELSHINSVRLGDINRLQNKIDKLDGFLHSIDDAYSEMPVNKLRPGYYDGMVKFCNDVFDILDDWKKL